MGLEDNFVIGIHNYCDRWCERCDFTSRCHVFAMEEKASDSENDPSPEALVRTLTDILADAKQMLLEKADELGIDLEAAATDTEIEEGMERQRSAVEDNEAVELARDYAIETRPVLEASGEWLRGNDDPMTEEMLEILQWYVFFIAAKVHRGFFGIIDLDGDEESDQLNDPQSDANGSIKIATISIERSILAWTYLLTSDNSQFIRPRIDQLETIRSLLERKFPIARDFIRPGFDEIEMVM